MRVYVCQAQAWPNTDNQGEIRATGFNEQVDKFFDKLEEGKVSTKNA
jgi:hypothetical protein